MSPSNQPCNCSDNKTEARTGADFFFLCYISELEIEECNEKRGKKKARVYTHLSHIQGVLICK